MKRTGLVYTTFAIVASSLLLMMSSVQIDNSGIGPTQSSRIGEASFFLESVLDDMDRTLSISSRRALTASTNYVVETGNELKEPEKNITSALVNGTISGTELESTENASLKEWTERVRKIADRSGYSLDIEIEKYSFNSSNFNMDASYTVFARLEDPETRAAFNKTRTADSSVPISGLEDTMILLQSRGRYVSQYERCSFDEPVEQFYTGSGSSGTAHGYAVVEPADASSVSDKSESIIVAEDIESYDTSVVDEFAGAVSAQPSSSTYNTEYVFDTGSISAIDEDMSLILHQDRVWRSGFREMFRENCYVPDPWGPDFMDRMGNEMVNEGGEGITTLIDVSSLPTELRRDRSMVDYIYFNESSSYGSLSNVRGVSGDYPWFQLDQDHVDEWGLNQLAY